MEKEDRLMEMLYCGLEQIEGGRSTETMTYAEDL